MKYIIISLLSVGFLFSCKNDKSQNVDEGSFSYPFTKEGTLSFEDGSGNTFKTIDIEFAQTTEETNLGLMDRDSMQENQGMLFIMPNAQKQTFYMRNTRFPLDLVYISADSVVVDIQQGEPFNETTIPSDTVSQYVLELNKGMANKWGIKENETKVSWQKDSP